ncbi:hypothetical protein N7463_010457 [Penicillium fimorum]|uniref:Uncharacterized protein n=1 Tax=Penicillium fimorum TaxID=1882269 RepID=A0A9W9XKP7_9EURO|nr:hypothetical protein N7463_010457 [Penicillium fimorum]
MHIEGPFCCANDTRGFYTTSDKSVGCAKAEDVHNFGVKVRTLGGVIQADRPTSSSSTTKLSSPTLGTTNNGDVDTSHSNTVTIAGGVVGGIAGFAILVTLAWCILRRRRKHAQSIQRPPVPISELSDSTRIAELCDSNRITELSGQGISELLGSKNPYGYSLRRNGTCALGEKACTSTWDSFLTCCPGNTECSVSGICCPTEKNCTALLNEVCADDTANLYYIDTNKGTFCCANDTVGFRRSNNWVGCAKPEDVDDFGVEVTTMRPAIQTHLPTSSSSNTATSTTPSSSTSGAVAATPTPTNNANTDTSPTPTNNANTGTSHSNIGAIAGGVVGGVAGVAILIALAWYLLRGRKKQAQDSQSIQRPPVPVSELSDSTRVTELSGQGISELPGSEKQRPPPAELP